MGDKSINNQFFAFLDMRTQPNKKRVRPWATLIENIDTLPGRDVFPIAANKLYSTILSILNKETLGISATELIEKTIEQTKTWRRSPNRESIRKAIQNLLIARLMRTMGYLLSIDILGILYLHDTEYYKTIMRTLSKRLPEKPEL